MEKSRIFQLITETSTINLEPDESGEYRFSEPDELVPYVFFKDYVYHLDIIDASYTKSKYHNVIPQLKEIMKTSVLYGKIQYATYEELMNKFKYPKYIHFKVVSLRDLAVLLEGEQHEHLEQLKEQE